MVRFSAGRSILFSPRHPDLFWGPPSFSSFGTCGSFVGSKGDGCETDNLHISNAEVKTAWSYTSSPTYAFVAYTRTTLPLLLPLNDFQYHFKGDNHEVQKNSTKYEESWAKHCHRPEIIYAVLVDASNSGFDQGRENCLITCCI